MLPLILANYRIEESWCHTSQQEVLQTGIGSFPKQGAFQFTSKYSNPEYRDPQNGTPNSGKPSMRYFQPPGGPS